MTDIRFYHLETQTLDQALPGLVSKAFQMGKRIVIKGRDTRDVERLAEHLWTYTPDSFLPHGTAKDRFAAMQPIFLTDQDENPNAASVLILTGGVTSDMIDQFEICCEMLNGHMPEQVTAARQRWKTYGESGHKTTYWQQGPQGWAQKGS